MGGLAAGCSSSVARFNGIDDVFTASTANQRSIIKEPGSQPFPGDAAQAAAPTYAAPSRAAVEPVTAAAPVQRSSLPPVAAAEPAPTRTARLEPASGPASARGSVLDDTTTGSVEPVQASLPQPARTTASGDRQAGWNTAGGTEVTVKQGETVYNLSRRFGIPANDIMRANGLANADSLRAGQKLIIPAYTHAAGTPVSAPDANPNVADAKSSRGTKYDVPADRVPTPSGAPAKNLAVLPQTPGVQERPAVAETAPATGAAPSAGGYTVAAGDSLHSIARKTGSSTQAIMAANGLKSPMLKIGQKLVIPAGGAGAQVAVAPSVDSGTTGAVRQSAPKTVAESKAAAEPRVEPAAYTPPRKLDSVMQDAVEEAAVAPNATGVERMRWPVRGRVVSGFGSGRSGDGIDIAVPEGTPVKAAENGVVIYAGNGLKEFGNTVLVRHEDGLVTVYGHASELNVKRGDKVRRGQEIARSGMSGSTDTPKLHFEVRKDSAPVDPAKFLE